MERKKILEPTPSQCVDRWVEMYFEEKHRADVAEEALRELIAEMYENGIRPICNQEMLYETRLEQAEERLKENE